MTNGCPIEKMKDTCSCIEKSGILSKELGDSLIIFSFFLFIFGIGLILASASKLFND
jgi:hypothetical protein